MRTINRTNAFKRDYKREQRGQYRETLDADIRTVVGLLIADSRLPDRYQDHTMRGQWGDCRNCHVRPDLVLLYRKIGEGRLELVRLGSHSQLDL